MSNIPSCQFLTSRGRFFLASCFQRYGSKPQFCLNATAGCNFSTQHLSLNGDLQSVPHSKEKLLLAALIGARQFIKHVRRMGLSQSVNFKSIPRKNPLEKVKGVK
jgi:hypothetical protein